MAFEKIDDADAGELKDKVILLYGFSGKQVARLMDHYKAEPGLPKASFAVVTPMNRVKRVKDVIQDIVADAEGTR
jgi:hypothetical protein